jgi:hypothetical protein
MSNYPVDSNDLRGRGTKGVMSTIGGLGLLGVNFLLSIPVIGWVVGGGLVFLGVSSLFGKSRTDRTSGGIMLVAGAAGLASIFLHRFTGFILGAGGLALIGYGAYNIYKFVKGLRDRA